MTWETATETKEMSTEAIRIWALNFCDETFNYEDLQELLNDANKISNFILEGKIDA